MKIVFKTQFGSHLYGTNTEFSDTDYKAVYVVPTEDIILGRDKANIQQNTKKEKDQRNSKDDIDCEYIELRKFLKDCMDGQTYALDMMFAPAEFWDAEVGYSDVWRFIQHNYKKLLSKNVEPYIGYCRQQAGKYGLKGSRLGELHRVIDHLKGFEPTDPLGFAILTLRPSEFVFMMKNKHKKTGKEQEFLEVLGKRFEPEKKIKEVLPALELTNAKYGERAELAKNNEGVDFKAVSHAFRCCYQLIELAETGEIKFPLRDANFLRRVKLGVIPYVDLQERLYDLMETAIKAVEKSSLPDQPDRLFWEQFILKTYLR